MFFNDVKTKVSFLSWDESEGNSAYCSDGIRYVGGIFLVYWLLHGTWESAASREKSKWSSHEDESTDEKQRGGAICSSDENCESRRSEEIASYGFDCWTTSCESGFECQMKPKREESMTKARLKDRCL